MASITDSVDLEVGGITEEMVNDAIASGDLDRINALLNGENTTETQGDLQFGEENIVASSDEGTNENQSEESDQSEGRVIATRDGNRTIPYEVLAGAREQAKQLAAENAELKSKVLEHESKNQKVEKFLEAKGIDATQITDAQASALSVDELSQLDELDPVLGKAIRMLTENIASTRQVERQYSEEIPVHITALQNNTDLSAWKESDADRWEFACLIDDKLKQDPQFKETSYAERFAEVARRTKIAFGDATQQAENKSPQKTNEQINEIARKKVSDAMNTSVPRSLSNLGTTPNAERSTLEIFADKNPSDLLEAMANMHPSKMMEMLQQIE